MRLSSRFSKASTSSGCSSIGPLSESPPATLTPCVNSGGNPVSENQSDTAAPW